MSQLHGVSHIEVSLKRAEAIVWYEPERITPTDIVATINRLGPQARILSGTP